MREQKDRLAQRRLGRPPLPRDHVRSERVVSFVTRGEFDALVELAETNNQSVSGAVHQILTSALTNQIGPGKEQR